jgi:hypothetical protein
MISQTQHTWIEFHILLWIYHNYYLSLDHNQDNKNNGHYKIHTHKHVGCFDELKYHCVAQSILLLDPSILSPRRTDNNNVVAWEEILTHDTYPTTNSTREREKERYMIEEEIFEFIRFQKERRISEKKMSFRFTVLK